MIFLICENFLTKHDSFYDENLGINFKIIATRRRTILLQAVYFIDFGAFFFQNELTTNQFWKSGYRLVKIKLFFQTPSKKTRGTSKKMQIKFVYASASA